MNSMEQFLRMRESTQSGAEAIHNLDALTLSPYAPRLRILWMYPDILSLHGGRGDMMALLRFGTAMGLPLEIRRINQLTDPIPLDSADLLYFCSGELSCVPPMVQALLPMREQLSAFADSGKMIVAVGSTGAILSKELRKLDGSVIPGLGLLNMYWNQRKTVYGNDIWMDALEDTEVIGNQILLADVTLAPDQVPFGRVRYGYGNCGDGFEGAVTKNVIYTSCLGPMLVRNPAMAVTLLRRAADAAGIDAEYRLDPGDIALETKALEDSRIFISSKMKTT